jgi:hypothetical protein
VIVPLSSNHNYVPYLEAMAPLLRPGNTEESAMSSRTITSSLKNITLFNYVLLEKM